MKHAVHQPGRRLRQAEDLGHVDEREQVDDAEPAATATEGRRQIQPAQVAVGKDVAKRRADGPAGASGRAIGAALTDEDEDEDGDDDGRYPEEDRCATPADGRDERRTDERDHDGADVAARDVGADREPAPLGRELLREQAVADRVLRR